MINSQNQEGISPELEEKIHEMQVSEQWAQLADLWEMLMFWCNHSNFVLCLQVLEKFMSSIPENTNYQQQVMLIVTLLLWVGIGRCSADAAQCSVASLVKVGGWTHQTVTGDSQWSPRSIALVSSQIRRSTSQVTSHNHDMSRVSRRELSTFHWSCHGMVSIRCENTIQFRFYLKY